MTRHRRGESARRGPFRDRAGAPGRGTGRASWAASARRAARSILETALAPSRHTLQQQLRPEEYRGAREERSRQRPSLLTLELGAQVRRRDGNRATGGNRDPVLHENPELLRKRDATERREPE